MQQRLGPLATVRESLVRRRGSASRWLCYGAAQFVLDKRSSGDQSLVAERAFSAHFNRLGVRC
jgi:hypothetical protein